MFIKGKIYQDELSILYLLYSKSLELLWDYTSRVIKTWRSHIRLSAERTFCLPWSFWAFTGKIHIILYSWLFQSSSFLHNTEILLSYIITFSIFCCFMKEEICQGKFSLLSILTRHGVLLGLPSKLHVIHGCPCEKLKKKNRYLRNRHKTHCSNDYI